MTQTSPYNIKLNLVDIRFTFDLFSLQMAKTMLTRLSSQTTQISFRVSFNARQYMQDPSVFTNLLSDDKVYTAKSVSMVN